MWNNEQKNIWQDIKDTWNDQPQSEKINIQVSQLLNEFKSNHLSFITNIIFEKEVGRLAEGSTKFDISNRIMLNDPFGKGFNIGVVGFSEFGYLTKFDTYTNQ